MESKLECIKSNEVAVLTSISDVPRNKRVLGTNWVSRVNADGRLKSRIVVLGWRQRHGIDCGHTFAPVCRFYNQRLLLAIAAAEDWRVISIDVQTAFLNGVFDKDDQVFLKQAPGFKLTDGKNNILVMKLGTRQRTKQGVIGILEFVVCDWRPRTETFNLWHNVLFVGSTYLLFKPTTKTRCPVNHRSRIDGTK